MSAAPDPPTRVSRLVLWRHGRTAWNAEGRFQGQLDPPLDDEGHHQAAVAAGHLVSALELTAADTVVVSSDLDRAVQTATALTGLLGLPLEVDARLREHGLGRWEGLTRDEVAAQHPEQYADWLAGRPVRDRGGEEPAAVAARALSVVAGLPPARVAVLVSHGGTSGRLLEALLDLGPEHRRVFGPLGNCAWTEVVPQGSRWRVVRHNWSPLGDMPSKRSRPAVRESLDGATPEGAPPPPQDADALA
ncbi:histidine phosphatase family protein [Blastococcus sp. TF02A-26]|uniref:histidine phosphatase family protein n=1 Tax=Blastococcus sp. TF02A-26 TaxID=2250577 RepID=UPI000DEB4667|nr:histidine phosphatase family protein [Blastococcus sp. TF02A-26]RBY83160.1 histidine phosphatase family protein [Blastococcus sp. TF02A-26]